jgi:hypothetical protein
MRWQVVSTLALWVGGEIAFLAFLWQPWLLWPGSVLMVAGFAGMIVTVRGESRGRPGADLMSGIVDHTREVHEGRVQILGADHPEVLRSRGILAGIYARAGRMAEAIDHFEQNLADAERVLGPDHRGTLLYRNNLAGAMKGRDGRWIPGHLPPRRRPVGNTPVCHGFPPALGSGRPVSARHISGIGVSVPSRCSPGLP